MENVLYQLKNLSAGTIASLSNLRNYEDIDALRESLVKFAEKRIASGVFGFSDQWQTVWNQYKINYDFWQSMDEQGVTR